MSARTDADVIADVQQALIVQLDLVRELRPVTPRGRLALGAAIQGLYEALDRLGDARAAEGAR